MPELIVLTDLDGTLLDPASYSFQAAEDALKTLDAREIPVVLVSSKTRAEVEPIRFALNNNHPFIVENGGALFVPKGLFAFPLEEAIIRGPYQVVETQTTYVTLRKALKEIEQGLGASLRGFGDMPPEEVAVRTGLSRKDAFLAKQREYDEPFVIERTEGRAETPGRAQGRGRGQEQRQGPGLEEEAPDEVVAEVERRAEARGLRLNRGGRFFHLTGNIDKGQASQRLIDCYRRHWLGRPGGIVTVGLGDGPNDHPMLALVDRPVAVQRPDGSYHPSLRLPNLVKACGVGPTGWNRAVLELLSTL